MKRTLTSLLSVAAIGTALACTNLLAGRDATVDGSTFVTYAADSHVLYGELYHFPAADHPKGTMREVREWDSNRRLGAIPEAPHTFNVVGNMNEHQLTIAETTFGGRHELVDTTGIIDYGSLIYIALQRCTTAREAIDCMTSLVDKYGYCSEGESFSIADPREVWVMEMVGKGPGSKGAVWVAIRIPDDCISAHANHSRIHKIPFADKKNCRYSPDVVSFARSKGWYDGKDADFDFSRAYAPADYLALRGCDGRAWAFFNHHVDGMDRYLPWIMAEEGAEVMPLYFRPKHKLSVRDMQSGMRDHFEGTPMDMTHDIGAGPWQCPYRFRPLTFKVDSVEYFNERATATQQTGFSFVAQMRASLPNAIGGVLWFGVDDAATAPYLPMYCSITRIPHSYAVGNGDILTFSADAAFWVNNMVANQAYGRYSLMIGDINKVLNAIEDSLAVNQPKIEKEALALYGTNPGKAITLLNDYTIEQAESATKRYRELAEFLLVKYLDGNRKKESNGQFLRTGDNYPASPDFPGYNDEYYRNIARTTGNHLRNKEVKQ